MCLKNCLHTFSFQPGREQLNAAIFPNTDKNLSLLPLSRMLSKYLSLSSFSLWHGASCSWPRRAFIQANPHINHTRFQRISYSLFSDRIDYLALQLEECTVLMLWNGEALRVALKEPGKSVSLVLSVFQPGYLRCLDQGSWQWQQQQTLFSVCWRRLQCLRLLFIQPP